MTSAARVRSGGAALLASVRSLDEARLCLAAGVDIIDLKEPKRGALGAVSLATCRAVVALAAGARPVSATIGEVGARCLARALRARAATGVDIVKVGLEDRERALALLDALPQLPGIAVVAVAFADRPEAWLDVHDLARAGAHGLMLDTAAKSAGPLTTLLPLPALAGFVHEARCAGLRVGLAGSLRGADVAPLAALGPDWLGFRGALCRGGREGTLDAECLHAIAARMAAAGPRTDEPNPAAGAPREEEAHVLA